MKKALSVALCASMLGAMMLGQTVNVMAEGDGAELEFYHGYFQDDWQPAVEMRKIYGEFAAENPGFKPIAIQTGSEGVGDKVTSEVANGSFPNMVDLAGNNVLEAAISGELVLDLKPIIDEDEDLKAGVGTANYEQNQVDGKIYTVRDQIETQGFWYNEAIFEEAGAALPETWTSWEDFSKAAQTIRDAGFTAYMLEESSSQRLAGAWLASTEAGRAMLEGLPEEFDTEEFKATMAAIGAELKANGENNISAKGDAYRDDFFKGSPVGTPKVAMCFNGVWDAGSAAASDFKDDIKPATYPSGDNDAAARFAYSSAGAGYAISADLSEEQKELAVKFLKYMMSDEVQTKIITLCEANPGSTRIDYEGLLADENTSEGTKKLIEACQLCSEETYQMKTLSNVWGGDIAKAVSDQMLLFPTADDMDQAAQDAADVLNSLVK